MRLSSLLSGKFFMSVATCLAACFLPISVTGQPVPGPGKTMLQDEYPFPKICTVLPGPDIASLAPFTIPLLKSESNYENENGSGCLYRFKSPDDIASINITLLKHSSAKDANTAYKAYSDDHRTMWGKNPEGIPDLGDTAVFSYNAGPETLCDICGLTMILGPYYLTINMGGQYDEVSREQKKQAAIKMAVLLMDRVPQMIKK